MSTMVTEQREETVPESGLSKYTLPGWFLDSNVKTQADLARLPDQDFFCGCKTCKNHQNNFDPKDASPDNNEDTSPEDIKDTSAKSEGSGSVVDDECLHNDNSKTDMVPVEHYIILRELTAAAFVSRKFRVSGSAVVLRIRGPETQRPFMDHGVINYGIMEPQMMGDIATQLAKSLNVSLVTVDWETLEELGHGFYLQEQQAKEQQVREQHVQEQHAQEPETMPLEFQHSFPGQGTPGEALAFCPNFHNNENIATARRGKKRVC